MLEIGSCPPHHITPPFSSQHIVKALTCHFDRPGDEGRFYYVALEHCDFNLRVAVDRTNSLIKSLVARASRPRTAEFPATLAINEDAAPMLLWQTRRSIARQLLSGLSFLHRTGLGPLRRIYHGNLKPSNILLKNGIVKISEVNCYYHTDPAAAGGDGSPPLRHSVSIRDLGEAVRSSEDDASRRVFAALQQAEFAPLLSPGYAAALAVAQASVTKVDLSPVTAGTTADDPTVVHPAGHLERDDLSSTTRGFLPSTLSTDGRLHLIELISGHPPPSGATGTPAGLTGHGTTRRAAFAGGPYRNAPSEAGEATHKARRASLGVPTGAPATTPDAVTPSLASRGLSTELLYRLASYGDTFAAGCLVHFCLTLGQHPFGTVSLSPLEVGTAAVNIARYRTVSAAQLAPALFNAAQEASIAHAALVEALASGEALAAQPLPHGLDFVACASRSPSVPGDVQRHDSSAEAVPGAMKSVGELAEAAGSVQTAHRSGAREFLERQPEPPTEIHRRLQLHESRTGGDGGGAGSASTSPRQGCALDYDEAADLIAGLLDPDPRVRLTPQEALSHPFFWSPSQKFLLVTLVSETTVVRQDRAVGPDAAFAADIQARFLARLPPGE